MLVLASGARAAASQPERREDFDDPVFRPADYDHSSGMEQTFDIH